jgi:UPF0755 protein
MKLLKYLILFVLVVFTYIFGREYHAAVLREPPLDGEVVNINIPPGTSFISVSKILEQNKLIERPFFFKVYAKMTDQRLVQAGDFSISRGSNYKQILSQLRRAAATDVQITFPEGLNNRQVGEIVIEKFNITQQDWQDATNNLEGKLFPDTYRFLPNATAQQIVNAMVQNFERRIQSAGIEVSDRDLIIASIIEREVRGLEDMKLVSDIIRKRLEIGMPLQMDSTVNYITSRKTPSISLADRDIDSPYNTYKYAGLPPGPIANPGLNALIATKNPTPNRYFYFLTNPQGKVFYAETFDQHIANRVHLR